MNRGHPGQQVYTNYTKCIPYGVDHARPGSFPSRLPRTTHSSSSRPFSLRSAFPATQHTQKHDIIAIDTITTKKQTYADN